jgi:IS30 family transposase
MTRTYQQLTYEQRCQISVLTKSGFSQRAIACSIDTSQSTVSREIARNSGQRGYRYKQAQEKFEHRRQASKGPTRMLPGVVKVIETKLEMDWSPEQISGWLEKNQDQSISHESIYLHVWHDKKTGGDLYQHLRQQGKKYDKRRHGKSTRGQIINRVSIDERPDIVDQKSRVGDWEIDTVIGKGHSGALVTIVERKTKFTVSSQVMNKSAAAVTQATIKLLQPYQDVVHTITADNGKEFAYHEQISKALNTKVYFAHPYSSWERGLNENTNGLLRQYFPKITDFKQIKPAEVVSAVTRLNNRPRKLLDYRTPGELMKAARKKLAA